MNLLEVSELNKSYKRGILGKPVHILKGLSFAVPAGKITGFLGANGAGKTTTMRCILGLDYMDSGRIHLFGEPLSVANKRRLGFLPEHPYFYEHLTAEEFLQFYAQLTMNWKKAMLRDRIDELLRRVNLEFAKHRILRSFSKGMLQKIGFAQALIHDPELVILDEPMSGLDPDGRLALAELIMQTAQKGTAVFFTSHLLHDTERLCERLVMMRDGRTIYEGNTDTLLEQGTAASEIVYLSQGSKQKLQVVSPESVQSELKRLLNSGATVLEVRPLRATLEEVFVRMALRKGTA